MWIVDFINWLTNLFSNSDNWQEGQQVYTGSDGAGNLYHLTCGQCQAVSVPEPGTWWLVGTGFVLVLLSTIIRAWYVARKQRSQQDRR